MKSKDFPRPNNRTVKREWQPVELEVLRDWAGKVPLSELVDKVNEVSLVTRKLQRVQMKANNLGWSVAYKG